MDEKFDAKATNKSQSKGKSAASPMKGKIPKEEASDLINRLDDALLASALSPADAFKAADLNNNGIITIGELKSQLQTLLEPNSFKPAEFKLLMLAMDENRNGQIDQDEYISCF